MLPTARHAVVEPTIILVESSVAKCSGNSLSIAPPYRADGPTCVEGMTPIAQPGRGSWGKEIILRNELGSWEVSVGYALLSCIALR